MKNFLLGFFLLTGCFAYSQQPNSNGNFPRLQGLKIAFLTRQLNLTPDEATKFWPVYYSYSDEVTAIRKETKNDIIAGDERLLEVKKKYYPEFKRVLITDERVNKVFLSDREFGNYIKKEIEERQKLKQQRLQQKMQP